MKEAGIILGVCAVSVLILGRFHFLFRERRDGMDLSTGLSYWLRIGSVLLFNVLLLASLICFVFATMRQTPS